MEVEIARTVRFCVNPLSTLRPAAMRHNTFAGWPSMLGLGAFYELDVCCRGRPDPLTGYLLNISAIDQATREAALPVIESAIRTQPQIHPALVLTKLVQVLRKNLSATLTSVRWRLSPYYWLVMHADAMDKVLVSQQFEFSAAHRLHCPELDEQANRKLFGKCNNANGHGHNYRLEVAVTMSLPTLDSEPGLPLEALESVVDETVIRRFDHKHLNLDTAEFAGLNPSVEHIARVCHNLLVDPIRTAGAELHHVTVWETTKTSCTYPAPAATGR